MDAEAKREARGEARRVRRQIPDAARAQKDARIMERFLGLPEVRGATTVACYVAVKSEAATLGILRSLLARGAAVAVPVLVPVRAAAEGAAPEWRMRFVRLNHPWGLEPGAHGIPEPRQPWTEVPGEAIDVVGVPGLRFARDGARLGNGGGHFDRYLAEHPRARRVGLAYAEQVVDALPGEAHDVQMDVVVTDAEVLRVPRKEP